MRVHLRPRRTTFKQSQAQEDMDQITVTDEGRILVFKAAAEAQALPRLVGVTVFARQQTLEKPRRKNDASAAMTTATALFAAAVWYVCRNQQEDEEQEDELLPVMRDGSEDDDGPGAQAAVPENELAGQNVRQVLLEQIAEEPSFPIRPG